MPVVRCARHLPDRRDTGRGDSGGRMSAVQFTPHQLDAMDVGKRNLDACVVAGPGSGKTTVLVEYFRRLVAEGIDPLRILAITFTEKAAGNMRKKLAEAFHEDSTIRAALERAWVSTVHGFCGRLLRENAVFAGVDPEFTVAAARESWRMQQEAMAEAMESLFREHPAAVRALVRGLSSMDFEESVLSAYDAMRGAGMSVEQMAAIPPPAGVGRDEIAATLRELRNQPLTMWKIEQREHLEQAIEAAQRILESPPADALAEIAAFPLNLNKCKRSNPAYEAARQLKELIVEAQYTLITELYASERRLLLEIFRRFDRLYRERKRQASALDFADLEEFTVRLLENHPEVRARLQQQFDHILMDEFQDTNGQQAKLLSLIRPADRFYAVGDINQSIFGFRHAEPEGFERYRTLVEETGRHMVELRENFRSRAEILRAVEDVVGKEPGIVEHRLIPGRKFDTPRPECVEAMYVAPGEAEEAKWVARRVLELTGEGFSFQDVAVLVRNTEVIPAFTAAFDAAGVPYVVNQGRGFYESREVVDLTHLLRMIANPRDEISAAAVLRSPLVGASDEDILALRMKGDNIGASLMGQAEGKLAEFVERVHGWRVQREHVTFDRLLLEAIDECGYPTSPNVDKFLAQARDAAAVMSLDAFVQELELVREENPREPDAPPEDSTDAVKVMTVHSAKGLEFPIVFLAALHKGIDTDVPVVAFSRTFGLGARWRMPDARKDKDDLFQHSIREERKRREAEESSRLLYVAMTRAEEHLVLSFSGKKPANWAGVVARRLGLADLQTVRDEVVEFDGWKLRVLVTQSGAGVFACQSGDDVGRRKRLPHENQLLPRPHVNGQHESSTTVTALSAFAGCPRKYFLGGYLGFGHTAPAPENDAGEASISAAELGSQVHELLADLPVEKPDPEAIRLAAVFRQSPLGRRAAQAERREREFDFILELEDLIVHGQIDLWFEEAGEIVIVDYKTDSVKPAEAHQRAQDYALQLRIYAMAVERVAGRAPRRACLHFLRPNTVVEVDLTPSLLDSPEQAVRDFVRAQETLEFPLNEGPQCRRCPFYRQICPAR
jgi:ATP-dependent exoDNAse (exonuclease V) beta subunit